MDGRVLKEIFRQAPQVVYDEREDGEVALPASQALQSGDESQLEERLRSLGYL
jgi:hypothetical protein